MMTICKGDALCFASALSLATLAHAWLPSGSAPLRGVNLGGLFVAEPWMMSNEWNTMGCAGQGSEWDCVKALGQEKADAAFQAHWARWISESDLDDIKNAGLNAVRIPTGYWMNEELVKQGEYFPKGGKDYLLKVCGWAADRGIYVIIE
jgi:glucan endo-1,6-beta-glucosidase